MKEYFDNKIEMNVKVDNLYDSDTINYFKNISNGNGRFFGIFIEQLIKAYSYIVFNILEWFWT